MCIETSLTLVKQNNNFISNYTNYVSMKDKVLQSPYRLSHNNIKEMAGKQAPSRKPCDRSENSYSISGIMRPRTIATIYHVIAVLLHKVQS